MGANVSEDMGITGLVVKQRMGALLDLRFTLRRSVSPGKPLLLDISTD